MDIYALEGFCEKMRTPEPDGITTGVDAIEITEEERYVNDAWLRTNRAHRRMAEGRHLAVRNIDWAYEVIGDALYLHTLWIMKWKGNESQWSKINRRSQVEAELGISLGGTGGDWKLSQ